MARRRRPFGVLGVYLVLLGAGLVLDASWWWRGAALMLAGAACLVAEWRQPPVP